MKTIYILNGHNTYNYGTFMMLINFISYTYNKSENKDLKFIVDFLEENDLERLKKELDNKKIDIEFLISDKNPPIRNIADKFKKLFFMIFKFQKEVLSYKPDTVVVLGGDDFSEYYGKLAIAIYMKILIKLNKKVPLFFVGQTIGPFTTYNKKIAKDLFSEVDITLRDRLCYNYMKDELNITSKKLTCYSDLAFLKLPLQGKVDMREKYGLNGTEYITFVASGLYFKYTTDKELYVKKLLEIISYLENKFPNKKIAFLGHVIMPEVASDNNIITEIKKILGEKEKYVYIQDKMLSSEARSILGGGYMTITGRMHAAISTLQTRKPAISLSYSVKYKGIISDDMLLPELVVESKGTELWKSGEVVEKAISAIDYLDSNYEEMIKRIEVSLKKVEDLSIENIDYFIKNT